MANKNNNSNQTITLPQGGGALHGIGETFSPDLHTGTGNVTVSIALPPGRNGFQPQCNLVYSTGTGNGPFGLGWSLSIPSNSVSAWRVESRSGGLPIISLPWIRPSRNFCSHSLTGSSKHCFAIVTNRPRSWPAACISR
jgi:Salmonella virulence plasmid 65kDa B protein